MSEDGRALVGINRLTGNVTAVLSLAHSDEVDVAEFRRDMAETARDVEETTVADARKRVVL